MAKAKKKESLTPEERLQAALVPESEQPYPVPTNWCWVQLGNLYQINPKNLAEDFVDAAFIPMEKIAPGFVNKYSFDVQPWCKAKKGHTQFADGDVAFAKISPCFENRKSMLLNNLPNGIGGGTTELVILRQSSMNPQYTFWFISQERFIRGGVATYSGTVGQQRISMDYVRTYPIPVPPLSEQQRIVDRIESLFSKLDEAKQKAQDALDSFETRKAAILHKAFTGELTAQWRKEHDVGMESWENSTVGQVCHDVKVGIVIKPSQYYTDEEKGTPAFRSANVRENRIDDFDWVYLNCAGMENNSRSVVHTGDVLVVRSGNPGTACVVSEKFDGYNAIDILIAVPDRSKITSEFLCSYTNSPFGKNLIFKNKRGMALAHFNVKGYSGLPIRIPKLNEQIEIVRILDDLLAKEQQAKEAAEGVLEQIDLMKKAILARAFRGELGTNDPREESAVELLKQVL